ncbi:OLC1v1024324C1 [Oldenlandia corymbosa var. corymbosa]|uniref:OLC1v1024324C1 n=1 Tax=Oldenlandia corymbosa var. corymbosa TaxID=529605 RepID=A0AAV1C206_OLDCO|nr:OLC1v1024324C1 [Oldenlandia corymbosa var. corymbosa]
MANASHLESMGKELKCPICLSLLNKAVSLTCNHVFCCCCIEESMKASSYCPVCKVPFRRREIRPAPHMDNLVNIYKSMEAASGVNIFLTQVAPPMRSSDIENHPDGGRSCELQDNRQTSTGLSASERKKRNAARALKESDSIPVKPSFPAKKRVHVPHDTPSDSRFAKLIDEPRTSTGGRRVDKPVLEQMEEPLFAPFFWLKDDNSPKTTQQSSGDQIFETPPDVPCFSDIKDSDDEFPCDLSPEVGKCYPDGEKDMFDSEMFEWTQRPCSPELCSSPEQRESEDDTECLKQVEDGSVSRTESIILESGPAKGSIMNNAADKKDPNFPIPCFPKNKTDNKKAGVSGKRSNKAVVRKQRKRAWKISADASEVPNELENLGEEILEKSGNGEESSVLKKGSKSEENILTDTYLMRTKGNLSSSCDGENISAQDKSRIVIDLPVQKKCRKRSTSKNIGQTRGSTYSVCKSSCATEGKSLKAANKSMDLHQSEIRLTYVREKSPCDEAECFDMGRTLKRCKANHSEKMATSKSVRFSEENNAYYHNTKRKLASEEVKKSGVVLESFNEGNMVNSSGAEASPRSFGDRDKNFCAFCHSTECSEVSGVMLHYLNGKPVAGDHIKGPNVIHCHKNCTEWAPNVFFEEDNAINLEAELRRSLKIKCGLCGNRGAALGCFERTCRKSFHIPCAKMTSQFRWDHENFVLLCPLHASSKLPCEMPANHSTQKKLSTKRDSRIKKVQTAKDAVKENLQWKSCKNARDYVLCCSGLTSIEKEIVSQLEKFSGITVIKNWDPSVTHVVAATDDNGACKRTLKFLMGVLEGKWILNIEWVGACIKSMKLVDEQPYEVKVDAHGIKDGPHIGRLRFLNKVTL